MQDCFCGAMTSFELQIFRALLAPYRQLFLASTCMLLLQSASITKKDMGNKVLEYVAVMEARLL